MWQAATDPPARRDVRRVRLLRHGAPASTAAVLEGWAGDAGCREVFLDALRQAPFAAWLWETPPVTRATLSRPFEFVLTDCPRLGQRAPDPSRFADVFRAAGPGAGFAVFASLGGDARLVAPCPEGDHGACPHLAAFVRAAPPARQHALCTVVGAEMARSLGDAPLWLSTNGLGVPWLHVRLDSAPKYYSHAPYRDPAAP